MKKCSRCNQIFGDENDFCLNDGTPLMPDGSSQETVILPKPGTSGQHFQKPTEFASPRSGGNSQYLMFGVILLLAILAVGFGVAYYVTSKNNPASPAQNVNAKVDNTQSDEKQKQLEAENERLRSALDSDKRAQSLPTTPTAPRTVRVNSPRDGILSLKDQPCSKPCGKLLYNIPHGTQIVLNYCKPNIEYADRRSGHWCTTSYAGLSGWVFDGFVD